MRPIGLGAFFALVMVLAGQSVRAAEIILYDLFNFQGTAITLTQSAPDLDVYGFDNDLESFRIISGVWSIHRDDNFQNANGPPLQLGPGDYPNIEQFGFPEDRASSVRLIQDNQCLPPYQTTDASGRCVFTCGEGTVGDPASGQCVCANRGLVETGVDQFGRRVCTPRTGQVPQPSEPIDLNPPPVLQAHWLKLDGFQINGGAGQAYDANVTLNAAFSSAQSLATALVQYRALEAQPGLGGAGLQQMMDAQAGWMTLRPQGSSQQTGVVSFQLSAASGDKTVYFQLKAFVPGQGGSVVSEIRSDSITYAAPATTTVHSVPAAEAFDLAKANGFAFEIAKSGEPFTQCQLSTQGEQVVFSARYGGIRGPGQLIMPGQCLFYMFGGRALAPGWQFGQPPPVNAIQCPSGSAELMHLPEGDYPFGIFLFANFSELRNPAEDCSAYRWAIDRVLLIGPVNANWRLAFQ